MPNKEFDELDWVKVRENLNSSYVNETIYEKAKRKMIQNPLVPLGCLGTTAALTYGLYSFYIGNRPMQQYMMRMRVGAQAFTIVCIAAGFIFLPTSK